MHNLLSSVETERKRITRNSALSLLDTVMTVLSYFFVMRQLVKASGLEALGLWSIVMGFLAFFRMLDQGGAGSITRFVASASGNDEEQATLIDTAFLFSLIFFMVVAFVGYFPMSYLLEDSVEKKTWEQAHNLLIGLLAVLPLNMVALGQLAALTGIGRADLRATINILATLFYVSIALMFISEHGAMALVYGQCAQYTLALVLSRAIGCIKLQSTEIIPRKTSFKALKQLIGFGARLQVTSVPIHIFHSLNRILIGRLAGLELLAIYELAYRFSTSARQFLQALLNPMMPEFARLMVNEPATAKKRFTQIAPMAIIATSGVSTVQLFAIPLVSYVMLGGVDRAFLLVGSCFTFSWGVANIGLTVQLYSRAAGVLRWAMVAQWMLLVVGVLLILIANAGLSAIAILIAPSVAIALGYIFAAVGESMHFGLNPFRGDRSIIAFAALTIFGSTAISAIVIAWTLLNTEIFQ